MIRAASILPCGLASGRPARRNVLPPMAVNPNPAATALYPMSGYPASARPRRLNVMSGYPDIGVSVPSMKPSHPHPTGVRTHGYDFDTTRWRRTNTHDNLRLCSGAGQKCGKCKCEEVLHHVSIVSFVYFRPVMTRILFRSCADSDERIRTRTRVDSQSLAQRWSPRRLDDMPRSVDTAPVRRPAWRGLEFRADTSGPVRGRDCC